MPRNFSDNLARAYLHVPSHDARAEGVCEHVAQGAPAFAGLSIDGFDDPPIMELLCLDCSRDLAACGVSCHIEIPAVRPATSALPPSPSIGLSASVTSDAVISAVSIVAPVVLTVLLGRLGLLNLDLGRAILWTAVLMDVPSWLLNLRDTISDPISAARNMSWAQALVTTVKLSLFMAAYWLMDAEGAAFALIPWITLTIYRAHLRSQL